MTLTDEEIRRIASAHRESWGVSHLWTQNEVAAIDERIYHEIRDAVCMIERAGYAIVPAEPTDEMLIEGSKYLCFHSDSQVNEDARLCYRAMLSALRKE